MGRKITLLLLLTLLAFVHDVPNPRMVKLLKQQLKVAGTFNQMPFYKVTNKGETAIPISVEAK